MPGADVGSMVQGLGSYVKDTVGKPIGTALRKVMPLANAAVTLPNAYDQADKSIEAFSRGRTGAGIANAIPAVANLGLTLHPLTGQLASSVTLATDQLGQAYGNLEQGNYRKAAWDALQGGAYSIPLKGDLKRLGGKTHTPSMVGSVGNLAGGPLSFVPTGQTPQEEATGAMYATLWNDPRFIAKYVRNVEQGAIAKDRQDRMAKDTIVGLNQAPGATPRSSYVKYNEMQQPIAEPKQVGMWQALFNTPQAVQAQVANASPTINMGALNDMSQYKRNQQALAQAHRAGYADRIADYSTRAQHRLPMDPRLYNWYASSAMDGIKSNEEPMAEGTPLAQVSQ